MPALALETEKHLSYFLIVNLAAVANFNNGDGLSCLINFIQNSIITLPQAKITVFSFEHLNAVRSWMTGKVFDPYENLLQVGLGYTAEFFFSTVFKENVIRGHPASNLLERFQKSGTVPLRGHEWP